MDNTSAHPYDVVDTFENVYVVARSRTMFLRSLLLPCTGDDTGNIIIIGLSARLL